MAKFFISIGVFAVCCFIMGFSWVVAMFFGAGVVTGAVVK